MESGGYFVELCNASVNGVKGRTMTWGGQFLEAVNNIPGAIKAR